MESIFFIGCNSIFYLFLYYILKVFNFSANKFSLVFLFIFSLFIYMPPVFYLYFQKNRKKYFIFSSVWIIISSIIIFTFGKNIMQFLHIPYGISNYTIYLYKYLFMFSSINGIFFVMLHKIFAQKKQLIKLIAFKYILPILIVFPLMHFIAFYHILWILAILDLLTTIFSMCFVIHKN